MLQVREQKNEKPKRNYYPYEETIPPQATTHQCVNTYGLVDVSFHKHIAVHDIFDVSSSGVPDFNIHRLVGSCESYILDGHILDSATHFASNGDACENTVTRNVPDGDIHRGFRIIHPETIPSRFDRDAVVGAAIGRIFDENISRTIRIPAICVGRSIRIENVHILDVNMIAVKKMISPKGGVAQSQIVHGNVCWIEELNQVPSSDGFASILMFLPPNTAITINNGSASFTYYGHIDTMFTVKQTRVSGSGMIPTSSVAW